MIRRSHLLLLLPLMLPSLLLAEPKLVACSIRHGNGLPRQSDTAALLNYTVENPDDAEARLMLTLRPINSENGAIYSRALRLPPKTRLEGRFQVVTCQTEQYLVQLIQNDRVLDKQSIIMRLAGTNFLSIGAVEDAGTLHGMGGLAKLPDLPYRCMVTTFSHASLPPNWAAIRQHQILLLHDLDLEQYTTAQLQAIREYVLQGGMLLLASPKGQLALRSTILEDFLPWTPVAVLPEEDSLEAARAFGVRLPQGKGLKRVNRLHTLPGNGVSLLEQSGMPVMALSRHGAGTVLALAYSPSELHEAAQEFDLTLWTIIQGHCNYRPLTMRPYLTNSSNALMQQLQGYSIPPATLIAKLLLLYLLVGAAILGVSFHLKKHASGWLALCGFGLVMTAFVMVRAKGVVQKQAENGMTTLMHTSWDNGLGASEADTMLLSQKDVTPTVAGQQTRLLLEPQPPRPVFNHEGKEAMAPSPLWILTDEQCTGFKSLQLRQMKPRTFYWCATGDDWDATPFPLPQLRLAGESSRLDDWSLPPQFQDCNRAMLILPGQIRALKVVGGKVIETALGAQVETDTVFTALLRQQEQRAVRSPGVLLVRSQDNCQVQAFTATTDAGDFHSYVSEQIFIPVKVEAPQKEHFTVPSDCIAWSADDKSLVKNLYRNGQWQETTVQSLPNTEVHFAFRPLAELFQPSPTRVVIDLSTADPGNIIRTSGYLVTATGTRIQATSTEGSRMVFDVTGKALFPPASQQFTFVLRLDSKQPNPQDAMPMGGYTARVLNWKIQAITATITY
ncbi:MAG: hypothetical protein IJJ33_00975 [Victivallales bacterium]|nr:hypothetical protein [Victivallales bacterium]